MHAGSWKFEYRNICWFNVISFSVFFSCFCQMTSFLWCSFSNRSGKCLRGSNHSLSHYQVINFFLLQFFPPFMFGNMSLFITRMKLKGVWPDHFWIHPSKWSFWYQKKTHIFLITPVKSYGQEMLILKVTSENVAKVHKW